MQEYHHHIGDCSEAAVAAAVAIVLVSVLWLSVESKPLAHWVAALGEPRPVGGLHMGSVHMKLVTHLTCLNVMSSGK